MKTRVPLLLLTILVAVLATASAWAQDGRGRHRQGHGDQGRQGNPAMRDGPVMEQSVPAAPRRSRRDDANAMAESIRRIERTSRGQVIRAERMQSDGREVNRIKVMDDRGRVRIYMDDPQQPQRRAPPTRDDDN